MSKKILKEEEKENLSDMLAHEGYSVLLKEMDAAVQVMQASVITYNLASGDERSLVRLKQQADGAAAVVNAIKQRLNSLKARQAR